MEFLEGLLWIAIFYAIGFCLFTAAELRFGRDPYTPRQMASGLRFWAIAVPVDAAVGFTALEIARALGARPLLTIDASVGSLAIAAVTAALWKDFAFYWFHRAQHRFLWRFHAVHHSIRHLSAVNSYHHWTEPVWLALLVSFPLLFVRVDMGPQLAWLAFILRTQSFFIHCPLRLPGGPLSRLLVGPAYHRIHHSLEPRHFDRNFGAMTPLWDGLFGTLCYPQRGEWPKVGLSDIGEPATIADWESLPRRMANNRGPAARSNSGKILGAGGRPGDGARAE